MTAARPRAVALAGLLSLAVAMGIGRFAFTPLLPMMLHDGVVDLARGTWLATANYLGYWIGALGCALQPWLWKRLRIAAPPRHTVVVRSGLAATVLLTAAMALPWAGSWPLWRFLAGVTSALVFVYTAGWCLSRLTTLGAPAMAGLIFVGPGLGITASGLAAGGMVAAGWSAAAGWLAFAALALALTALAWPSLQGSVATAGAGDDGPPAASRGVMALFTLVYGLAGLGYIVTATFLPVIARQALPGSPWLDLFWPIFGAAVAAGALLTVRLPVHWDRRALLIGCYLLQAAGVLLGTVWPSFAGFALGSLLLGLPFTAITLFVMQDARRIAPRGASAFIGLLTSAYALGQILGPPLAGALIGLKGSAAAGFTLALQLAAAALLAGAAGLVLLIRRHPLGAAR